MKINSKDLFNYISNLKLNEKVKFKVWYDDCYITEIFWDGENFNWESGDFTSGAFFDSRFDFEIIEEHKKIENVLFEKHYEGNGKCYLQYPDSKFKYYMPSQFIDKINELIDEVNKLKENK